MLNHLLDRSAAPPLLGLDRILLRNVFGLRDEKQCFFHSRHKVLIRYFLVHIEGKIRTLFIVARVRSISLVLEGCNSVLIRLLLIIDGGSSLGDFRRECWILNTLSCCSWSVMLTTFTFLQPR